LSSVEKDKPRPPVRVSLGNHVLGAANPHPDPSDLETMLDGASRRFARQPPKPEDGLMELFRKFVGKWLKKHMVPLAHFTDTSFETWIASTKYPLWRKNQLIKNNEDFMGSIRPENLRVRGILNSLLKVKSFQKDETYPIYKPARGINSRSDAFKVRVGPIFKLIEKELFSLDWFIKHTPADERAQEIKDALFQSSCKIIGTDYTSFESLFTKELMECCELQLYKYMTTEIDDQDWYPIVEAALTGENVCVFRDKFSISVDATRMSGEMCTSLGNSFTNLMAMKFIAKLIGMKNLRGRIEGDDGIFTFYGPTPTPKDFARIGLLIKIEEYDSLTEGSFCGIIADEDEMINVTNPITALLNFGWASRQYVGASLKTKLKLLKAKSLSLAFQYPGCPILQKLADYGMRMTMGIQGIYVKHLDSYHKEQFMQMYTKFKDKIPHKETGFKTRILVEKRFGISIQDQEIIESYLDNKTDLSPINCLAILSNCPMDGIDYYDKYVVDYNDPKEIDYCVLDSYSLKKNTSVFDSYEQFEDEQCTKCKKKKKESAEIGKKKKQEWRKKGDRSCSCAPAA
jgi:hypothetical protein